MTKYEELMESFKKDPEAFRAMQAEEKVFFLSSAIMKLQKLQHHMQHATLVDWFGEQLGDHLWTKFRDGHDRNLLSWLSKLSDEYRYFIIHELNTGHRWK